MVTRPGWSIVAVDPLMDTIPEGSAVNRTRPPEEDLASSPKVRRGSKRGTRGAGKETFWEVRVTVKTCEASADIQCAPPPCQTPRRALIS
jgi:hypothetical protein